MLDTQRIGISRIINVLSHVGGRDDDIVDSGNLHRSAPRADARCHLYRKCTAFPWALLVISVTLSTS